MNCRKKQKFLSLILHAIKISFLSWQSTDEKRNEMRQRYRACAKPLQSWSDIPIVLETKVKFDPSSFQQRPFHNSQLFADCTVKTGNNDEGNVEAKQNGRKRNFAGKKTTSQKERKGKIICHTSRVLHSPSAKSKIKRSDLFFEQKWP